MRKNMLLFIFIFQAFIFNLTNVITPQYLIDLNLSKYVFGYFAALWSFGMLISSPIWGNLGDRYKRNHLIVIGLIIYALSQLVFYYSTSIPVLAVFRVVSGIGIGAPVTLLLTYLISITPVQDRAKYLSIRMGLITLGGTLSYKVSGYLGLYFTREIFLLQALLTIAFVILVSFTVKDNSKKQLKTQRSLNIFNGFKNAKSIGIPMIIFLSSITLTSITFINIDKFIDIYVIDNGFNSIVLGNVKTVFGIITIVTNFFIIPKIKKHISNVTIMQSMQTIMSIIVLIVFLNNQLILMLYTVFLMFIVIKAIFSTSEQLFITENIPETDMGRVMGFRQSFTCLGMIIGPIIGGYLYQNNPINVFIFSVICLLSASVLLSYLKIFSVQKSSTEKSSV